MRRNRVNPVCSRRAAVGHRSFVRRAQSRRVASVPWATRRPMLGEQPIWSMMLRSGHRDDRFEGAVRGPFEISRRHGVHVRRTAGRRSRGPRYTTVRDAIPPPVCEAPREAGDPFPTSRHGQALDAETLWPSGAIEEIAEFLDGITCASRGGAACSHPRSSRHESFGTRPQPPCGYAAAGHAVRGPCVATRGNGV